MWWHPVVPTPAKGDSGSFTATSGCFSPMPVIKKWPNQPEPSRPPGHKITVWRIKAVFGHGEETLQARQQTLLELLSKSNTCISAKAGMDVGAGGNYWS